ncbi:hypothetical protein [Oceanibaculum pacificum]|uniref:hypothetical protein n=1 Tax=Oceanibaculum pacificum TaxID=580166 RepID=UPI000B05BCCA|nr:hypothetical protein [Oceanibaculum pacificum]
MAELPSMLSRGERARLFPVLADTSREGRTLSIFLSCFETVDEFGRSLLTSIDAPIRARTKIETFTEVVLKKNENGSSARPDGLILLNNGSKQWTALVEAKVGNSDLTIEQIEAYLNLAKANSIDALITLSNQFTPLPTHHPLNVPPNRRKVELYHWSWMYVVTQSTLHLSDDEVSDREQRVILREMNRFLLHPSSGVKGFDQMPAAWTEVVSKVIAGAPVAVNATETQEVVGAWHQEIGDLCLVLSRQLETSVKVKMSRSHAANPVERQRDAQRTLAEQAQLTAILEVPDCAAPIHICADFKARALTLSIKLKAPEDLKSAKARLNWLLRQLQKSEPSGLHIRCYWPGRAASTQHPLAALRENPDLLSIERPGLVLLSFDIVMTKDLGPRFGQRKNFISELETIVPDFY